MGKCIFVLTTILALFTAKSFSRSAPNLKITGGSEGIDGEYPYVVSIRGGYLQEHFCSGVIIKENWILTAAHCILAALPAPWNLKVITGPKVFGEVDPDNYYEVSHVIVNPYYDPWNFRDNIALLRTYPTIKFGPNVQSIEIDTEQILPQENVVAAGWGETQLEGDFPDKVHSVNLTTMSEDECKEVHGFVYKQICTYSGQGGTCRGDSGAPLVRNGKLVGFSIEEYSCSSELPDKFVRISEYVPWIDENIF